jgi:hypothetical protein
MFTVFAVLLNGILGPLKNKVGGVIAASWKGINYVRAYAIPSDPQSASQVTERTHFQQLGLFAKRILTTVIQPYWDPIYSQMSGYNGFMQWHRLNTSPPFAYADLFVTRGSLEAETIDSAIYSGTDITVSWTVAGLGNGAANDPVGIVVVDEDNDVAFTQYDNVQRSDASDTLTIGAGRTATSLHAYLFFTQGDGESMTVSNSDYQLGSAS